MKKVGMYMGKINNKRKWLVKGQKYMLSRQLGSCHLSKIETLRMHYYLLRGLRVKETDPF